MGANVRFVKRLAVFIPVITLALAVACSSSSSSSSSGDPDLTDGGGTDGTITYDATPLDAGPRTTCEVEHDYATACNTLDDLTCGADMFDAWCAGEDPLINSDAYRLGEAMCLTAANCDADARHDCQYRSYPTRTPTAAQKSLVLAYCTQCAPSDVAGCQTQSIAYNAPADATDIFIAAWELSDALVDEIRTTCTGLTDAGAPTNCAKAFSDCSGNIYVNHLPDCPQ